MACLMAVLFLCGGNLFATVSGLDERMFSYILQAPFTKNVSFNFVDVSDDKDIVEDLEIANASSTTVDTALYRFQIVSNFPRACNITLKFPPFQNETNGDYLGYTLKMFNESAHTTYSVLGTSDGSKTISLAKVYGPDGANLGVDTEYLYSFGYEFDLTGASMGRYVSNVRMEVTIDD